MSRKDDPIGEALGVGIGVTILLGKLGWKAVSALSGGAIAAADKAREVNVEKELQRQKPSFYFDQQIAAVPCAHCGVENEQGFEICYHCGELATTGPKTLVEPVKPAPVPSWVWGFLVILGVCVLCVVVSNLQSTVKTPPVSSGAGQNYQPTSTKYVYVNRGATATVAARQTVAAGGVLPSPTPRPPTVTPKPTATPKSVSKEFRSVWEQVGDLGAAKNDLKSIKAIEQPVNLGMMFYRGDIPLVYALFKDGHLRYFKAGDWASSRGAPLPPKDSRRLHPIFKEVVEKLVSLDDSIGVGIAPYKGVRSVLQDFENGTILNSYHYGVYILYPPDESSETGRWIHWEEANSEAEEPPTPISQMTSEPTLPTQVTEEVATATTTSQTGDTSSSTSQSPSLPPTNCSISADSEIMSLWGGQLGCPVEAQRTVPFGAEQPMQGGHLFWREDNDVLYAIFDRGKQTGEDLMSGEWLHFPNLAGSEGVCIVDEVPPSGTPPMVRGFSWWWCKFGGGSGGLLGWPLDQEYGRRDTFLVQGFDNGFIWKGSDNKVYALFYNGKFLARRF